MNIATKFYANYSTMLTAYTFYLMCINFLGFSLMGIDKIKAKKEKLRIRETNFMIMAILGASVGILIGMVFFHHKQSKKKFYMGIPLIYILNQIINIFVYNYLIIIK